MSIHISHTAYLNLMVSEVHQSKLKDLNDEVLKNLEVMLKELLTLKL